MLVWNGQEWVVATRIAIVTTKPNHSHHLPPPSRHIINSSQVVHDQQTDSAPLLQQHIRQQPHPLYTNPHHTSTYPYQHPLYSCSSNHQLPQHNNKGANHLAATYSSYPLPSNNNQLCNQQQNYLPYQRPHTAHRPPNAHRPQHNHSRPIVNESRQPTDDTSSTHYDSERTKPSAKRQRVESKKQKMEPEEEIEGRVEKQRCRGGCGEMLGKNHFTKSQWKGQRKCLKCLLPRYIRLFGSVEKAIEYIAQEMGVPRSAEYTCKVTFS